MTSKNTDTDVMVRTRGWLKSMGVVLDEKEVLAASNEVITNKRRVRTNKSGNVAGVRTLEGLSRLGCLGCAIEAEVVQRLS
jgi:hypothetical protein